MNKVIFIDGILYIQQYQNIHDEVTIPCKYCDCCERDREHVYACLAGSETRDICFSTGSYLKKISTGL